MYNKKNRDRKLLYLPNIKMQNIVRNYFAI